MKNTKMYFGYRYPSQVISDAVWLYHRFTLSFLDIEELLAATGTTDEAVQIAGARSTIFILPWHRLNSIS